MMPIVVEGCGVFIDNVLTVSLARSNGRPGSSGNGFAMWCYNHRPLGWIGDGFHLIECVVASELVNGALTPQWEGVADGARLIHPRYTLSVEQSCSGWVPKITDELSSVSHSLKPRGSEFEAVRLLDDLLRRRVGRERPNFDLQWWASGDRMEYSLRHLFQLALPVIFSLLGTLVQTGDIQDDTQVGEREASATELANFVDSYYGRFLDQIPLLGTILATYIKSSLVDLYGGAASTLWAPDGSTLTFTTEELARFRERFRRRPMADEEYLRLVERHFIIPVRSRRRKCRRGNRPASNKSYRSLRPRRDRGDYPLWPRPPGSRLWKGEYLRSFGPDFLRSHSCRGWIN